MGLTKQRQLTFASLFAGCGGLDIGFVDSGFKCIGAFDNDSDALTSHYHNLHSPVLQCDLRYGLRSLPASFRPDVVLSGSPCQGFSTAGKRNINDPRNELLIVAGRIATQLKPTVFLAENVAAVVSGDHAQYWIKLSAILRDAGYQTANLLCDASKLGVAQIRRRRILIAWQPQRVFNVQLPELPIRTLRDAICDVENLPNHNPAILNPQSIEHQIARCIGPGQKLSNVRASCTAIHTWDIPNVFGEVTFTERQVLEALLKLRRRNRVRNFGDADPVSLAVLIAELGDNTESNLGELLQKGYVRKVGGSGAGTLFDLVHTFNGKYRRLKWDEPSLTVDTRFNSPKYFLHPIAPRGFSIREAARIQGFPDNFIFKGTMKNQMQQVGNAVPPPVSFLLAQFIRGAIFD